MFLPTGERVCFECLHQNWALRMTTPTIAKQCFRPTDCQLRRIPVMHSIPGTYGIRLEVSRRRVYRLVGVKQAKQLAIEVHGSVGNLAKLMPRTGTEDMPSRKFRILTRFHEAPLEPPACDLSRLPEKSNFTEDDYGGMASIRFPYLTGAGADYGRLCQGCQVVYDHCQ